MMVDGLRVLLCRIGPGFDHLQDEDVERVDETGIDHLTFEVGEALGHQRRRHTLGWHWRQAKSLELVYISPRAVANTQDLACHFQRRNGDHALLHRPQCRKLKSGLPTKIPLKPSIHRGFVGALPPHSEFDEGEE